MKVFDSGSVERDESGIEKDRWVEMILECQCSSSDLQFVRKMRCCRSVAGCV